MKFYWVWWLCLAGIAPPVRAADALSPQAMEQRIEQVRTRGVVVRVLDQDRRPAAGAEVRAEMRRHQFLFGCNFFLFDQLPTAEENRRYLEMWSGLFNYATFPFYLSQYRPTADRTEEPRLREMARWCQNHGVTAKGHPLVWHFPEISPAWLPADPAAVEPVLQEHVQSVVQAFPEIAYWDALNEPTTVWMYKTPIAKWENSRGPLESARQILEWAGSGDGSAKFLINDYNVRFDLMSLLAIFHPWREVRMLFDGVKNYPQSYHRFLADLQRRGGQFQAIGIQSHMHMGNWPLKKVWQTCERYSDLGVPIHFTEVTVLSGAHKIMNPFNPQWNQPWPSTAQGEQEQADYVEKFYSLLFSHPAVQAITWWDLSDREAWMDAPAGLLRRDLSPKPAYERLQSLIHEKWWTDFHGRTDDQGQLRFRGFCGDYWLHLPGRAEPMAFAIDCARGEAQSIEVIVQVTSGTNW